MKISNKDIFILSLFVTMSIFLLATIPAAGAPLIQCGTMLTSIGFGWGIIFGVGTLLTLKGLILGKYFIFDKYSIKKIEGKYQLIRDDTGGL